MMDMSLMMSETPYSDTKELEQTIVDCSKFLWGDNSTEYVVGLLSSVLTKEQLKALAGALENKLREIM